MKKFLTTILAFTIFCGASYALELDETMTANVAAALTEAKDKDEAEQKFPSTDASKKAVVWFTFTAKTEIENGYPLTSHKECPAVIIDNEWLLASKTCMVSDMTVEGEYYQGASCPPEFKTCKVLNRWMENTKVTIDGKAYAVEVIPAKGQYLLYAKGNLSYALRTLPKANILVTGKNIKLSDYTGLKFFVNRTSLVFGVKEVQERQPINLCSSTGCISVKYSFWHTDAQSGDPLFTKLDNNMEFLVGFNSAQNYTDGKDRKSRIFKLITQDDIKEILKVIKEKTPQSYESVKKKTVNKITIVKSYYKYE